MKISLFIGCYNDALFPETGKAVVRVLERLGHEVEFLPEQTCCGQMHYNTGYEPEAAQLMRHQLEVFECAETVCVPSASCAAMMREHYPRLARKAGKPDLVNRAERLSKNTYEFSELLVDVLDAADVGAYYPHTVTLHPSCHSLRSLCVGDRPQRLLKHVRGLKYVELAEKEQCCGFGGTFSVKNADVSCAMLSEKIRAITSTGAQVCTALDNSCLMHIGGALSRQRTGIRTMHLAEILANTDATPTA